MATIKPIVTQSRKDAKKPEKTFIHKDEGD
jgi:hypothetical protein